MKQLIQWFQLEIQSFRYRHGMFTFEYIYIDENGNIQTRSSYEIK